MKKLVLTAMLLLAAIGFTTLAYADILPPIGEEAGAPKAEPRAAINPATLLDDAARVIDYLGVREGFAYNLNTGEWVTTTGATVVSYKPWNLSLGISMLDLNGVVADVAWNVGAYLPVENVPVMKYTEYLYLVAGVGGQQDEEKNDAFKLATILGAQFKFSF